MSGTEEQPYVLGIPYVPVHTVESLRELMAARRSVRFTIHPDFAPSGTDGWIYEIVKINRTYVDVKPSGGGRIYKTTPATLVTATDDEIAAYSETQRTVPPEVNSGCVVRLAGPRWNQDPRALWVVTGLKGMTEMSVARLGGDNGRVWPNLPLHLVSEVVAPRDLPAALATDPRFSAEGV